MGAGQRHMLYLIVATILGAFLLLMILSLLLLGLDSSMNVEVLMAMAVATVLALLIVVTLWRQWRATLGRRARTARDRQIVGVTVLLFLAVALFLLILSGSDRLTLGVPALIFALSLAAASYTARKASEAGE